MNFQKATVLLKDILTKENFEKLSKILPIIDQKLDETLKNINEASEKVKNATEATCEMITIDKLEKEVLKEIVDNTKTDNTRYSALLNGGRNKEDVLEIFMLHLDADKKIIDKNKVYCIRTEYLYKELKEAFKVKELVVLN